MKRTTYTLLALLGVVCAAVFGSLFPRAASAAAAVNSPTYYMNIGSNGFDPNSLVIPRNSTVVFTNTDSVNHAVNATNAAGAGPNSGSIPPGSTYSFTFQRLGPFTLVDPLNPSMMATVTVVVEGDPNITQPNAPPNTTKGSTTATAPSASGPVAAGYETSALTYALPIAVGGLCFAAATLLVFARHRRGTSGG